MDDVLTFEDHLAARFQHSPRLADCVSVVVFQFVISVVSAEAGSHRHFATLMSPPVFHVGEEGRIEHAVPKTLSFQRKCHRARLYYLGFLWRDVEAVFRARQIPPEPSVSIGHVALEPFWAVQLLDATKDVVLVVIDRADNAQRVRAANTHPAVLFGGAGF